MYTKTSGTVSWTYSSSSAPGAAMAGGPVQRCAARVRTATRWARARVCWELLAPVSDGSPKRTVVRTGRVRNTVWQTGAVPPRSRSRASRPQTFAAGSLSPPRPAPPAHAATDSRARPAKSTHNTKGMPCGGAYSLCRPACGPHVGVPGGAPGPVSLPNSVITASTSADVRLRGEGWREYRRGDER